MGHPCGGGSLSGRRRQSAVRQAYSGRGLVQRCVAGPWPMLVVVFSNQDGVEVRGLPNSRQRVRMAYGEGRDAIVGAVIRVVARDGLASLTYRSLANEAGISHGSIPYYFESLEAAVGAALQATFDMSVDALAEVSTPDDLFASLISSVRDGSPAPAFQMAVVLDSRSRPELALVAAEHYRRYRTLIGDVLERCRIEPQPAVVELILAAADGICYELVAFGEGRLDAAELQVAAVLRAISCIAEPLAAVKQEG